MKKRNGSGSRRLVEMTTKFQKSQHRLLETLGQKGFVTSREHKRLGNAVDRAVAQKRSSDVLSTAVSLNNRVNSALTKSVEDATEHREAREMELLLVFKTLLESEANEAELFGKVLTLLQKAVSFENGTLFLVDREEQRLEPVATRGRNVDLIDDVKFDFGFGFSAWVAKKKKPILIAELGRVGRKGAPEIRSFLSVPVVVQRDMIGVINLSHSKARAFDEDDLRIVGLIGGLAAGSLQRVQMKEEARRQSLTDRLTGLYGRRHFQERLNQEIERARRSYQPLSFVLIDVDALAAFNSRFGNQAGDRVLTEISKQLRANTRASDILSRYGGEEFAILMPATTPEDAAIAAERLRKCIETHTFPQKRRVTVSVGVASFPEDAEGDLDLIAKAEQALFLAKKDGPNRAVAFPAVAMH